MNDAMWRKRPATLLVVLATFCIASTIEAQDAQDASSAGREASRSGFVVPIVKMAYQGYLTNASGTPVNGVVSVVARIYNVPSGGSPLWAETHSAVNVASGVFQIVLGSVTPLDIDDFTGAPLYLATAINGEAELPRTQLLWSPFAMRAAEADHALTADVASDGVWQVNGNNAYRTLGNVGVGLSTPTAKLEITGASLLGLTFKADSLLYVSSIPPYVGVGRSAAITGADRFGVRSPVASGYGGMYIETAGTGAWPFYGYATNGSARAWHYYDGATGTWHVNNGSALRLSVESGGNVGIGQGDPSHKLDVLQTTGSGLGSVAIRAEHTASSGIAFDAKTTSNDATAVLEQLGTGDILRGFNGGSGPVFQVLRSGEVVTPVLQVTAGADLVESFETDAGECDAGTVVVIDDERPGKLRASSSAYDRKVAGIVSGAGGLAPGIHMGQRGATGGDTPVAMAGRVYVKCSAENGAIRPGDLLTTSPVRGHAMRASDPDRANGAVIGKAMSALDQGAGLVLVLVNLQ